MSEPIYTQPQIEEAWAEYKEKRVTRVLKDGKWTVHDFAVNSLTLPHYLAGATRSELVKLKTIMSFPKYLKKHYG